MCNISNLQAYSEAFLSLGLIIDFNFPKYFCTPENAEIIGHIGSDGIHFCVIRDEAPVYIVNPMMSDHFVELIAMNLSEFIDMLIHVKDAALFECMSYSNESQFREHLVKLQGDIESDLECREKITQSIALLEGLINTPSIHDVYKYIMKIRAT